MSDSTKHEHLAFTQVTTHGTKLEGVINLPENPGPRPTVLICHGFKGFLDWGFFPPLADLLVARGFTVVRWNFSGSGTRPGEDRVHDLDAFRHATFSRDVAEVLEMLDALSAGALAPGRIDPDRIALLGHSRGGGASILAAADPRWRGRLRALVTWASVCSFDRYPEEAKAVWRRDGALKITNARTAQELEIDVDVLEDLERHAEELDVTAAAARVKAPWLIAHGEEDETVPVTEAERLDANATAEHELLRVPGGSHTFGAKHPFVGPTRELIQAMNATQRWLRRHL